MISGDAFDDRGGMVEYPMVPEPETLYICMTRGEPRVRESINRAFGRIKHVIIDVDGERHKYDADAVIELLEGGAR